MEKYGMNWKSTVGWAGGWMDGWKHGWGEYVDEWKHWGLKTGGWMHGWMDRWMSGWIDGWMDTHLVSTGWGRRKSTDECMNASESLTMVDHGWMNTLGVGRTRIDGQVSR